MIYVKKIVDLELLPSELHSFLETNCIEVIEMLFEKNKYQFILINSNAFSNKEQKIKLWNIIKPHKVSLPPNFVSELQNTYKNGNETLLFPFKW